MVYQITYRRPAHVNSSSSSIQTEKSSKANSVSSGASGPYGVPEALSFERIINGGTCPPCTTREFMNFLLYVENAAENLQFYLWFRDYVQRFDQLPENEKKLSPEWVGSKKKPKSAQMQHPSEAEVSDSDKDKARQAVSDVIKGTDFDSKVPSAVPEVARDPFNTPPATSAADKASIVGSTACWSDDYSMLTASGTGMTHTQTSTDAFQSAKTFQPFTIQPFRGEISRIIAAYFSPEGSRCLNLSGKESTDLLCALSATTHPSVFREVVRTIELTLRRQAHPNFIRWSICNGNPARVMFARGLGIVGILGGVLCALIISLSSAGRAWRALSTIGFFVGFATLIAAWKGMCVVLHGLHHRHLRPWELFVYEEDIETESKNHSLESLSSSHSYENEPWVAKYEKRNLIRKIFDREVWIQEPALRQIQDTIFLQAALGALVSTGLAMAIFVPLPKDLKTLTAKRQLVMPSIPSRRSRDAENDDEGVVASAQTPSSLTQNFNKRRRRNHAESLSSPRQPPSPGQLQLGQRLSERKIGKQVGNYVKHSTQSYQPGAILRVKLCNFVTYSSVEFFPGPSLNMVIGPNGSGKSSLVCAICLGLGWSSQHLGRARDVSEFVKTGCREATIEIELQRDHHTRTNPIITRVIKKGDNKSYYALNGAAVPGKNAQALARSMNIQIDNLCQFLPQDKVVEFAAMTPIELLQSTQRAAAGPEMLQEHEDLKKLRAHHKELLSSSKGDREILRNLQSRQEMQRDDVERLRQRDRTKKKIAWLERCRAVPKYAAAKEKVKAAKERKNILGLELKNLKAALAPTLRLVNEKQNYELRVRKALQHGREVTEKGNMMAEIAMKKVMDLEQKSTESDGLIEAEKRSVRTKREDEKRIRGIIVRIKKQMEEAPESFDSQAANNKMAELNARRRQLSDDVDESESQLQDLKAQGHAKVNDLRSQQDRLADFDTQAGQQEHKLQQISQDSYRAWKWIQEHQDEFEHRIYGPPLIECSLKDPIYANAVESIFQGNDFQTFTAQSTNDFYKLQRVLLREMELKDVSFKVCSNSSMDQFRPPLSPEELRSCGMQGWAIDYLRGPEVVLAMLCGEKGLHATALTLQDISQDQFTFLQNSNVRSWVVNSTLFQAVRRREYGAAGTSTRTRVVKEARFWTNRPVNPANKERLQRQIRESEMDIAVLKDETKRLTKTRQQMVAECDALGEETETLKVEKDEKQRALTIFKALPTKLAQEEEKLAAIDKHMSGVRGRVDKILESKDKTMMEKTNMTLKYAAVAADFRKTHDCLLELEVQYLEAKSDYGTLRSRNEHINATLTAKQNEEKWAVEETTQESVKARELVTHVKALAMEARDLAGAGDPAWENYLNEFGKKSPEELEAEIESEKARLDLTHEGNGNIIQEFEERQRRIDKLQRGLEKFHEQKQDLVTAIEEIRQDWEPKLDALVAKISDAFSDSFARIGCAGQVTVLKASSSDDDGEDAANSTASNRPFPPRTSATDPTAHQGAGNDDNSGNGLDFAHWALHILVKFRSNEPLSLLDSHRQSGGERAVSTIFYLMALQSLSRAPFRVVDEINQGMDPRNERMVHGRMVDVACGAEDQTEEGGDESGGGGGGGQYFLITPKLLSGLKYRRGMRVLNIVSGAVLPAPPTVALESGVNPGVTTTAPNPHVVDFEVWIRRARELGLGSRSRPRPVASMEKRKAMVHAANADAGTEALGLEVGIAS